MSKEIAEDYASSLADLTVNSKPLINMLTILAEENIEHAGVIVETVEKHLEKVQPEIKLPVLYLVDSIIKNVGGAYTQKFAQSIVNMFTRTFKQVDEKTRSQMFKLRETWHDVFPGTKLYQLDVKVNLIDPAWPIQAQPQQSNIHVNPNFLKKTATTTSAVAPVLSEEEKAIIAKKEQELLMLQNKKIEMELEHTKKLLELAEKNAKKTSTVAPSTSMPVALVNPVMAPVVSAAPPEVASVSVKQRLGPPVHKNASGRIAPVSGALISARRDPRLARRAPPTMTNPTPTVTNTTPTIQPIAATIPPIAPHVFDIKPLERVTKRKNVITIDVRPDAAEPRMPQRDPRVRDPRLERRDPRREKLRREERRKNEEERRKVDEERRKVDEDRRKADEERRKLDEDRKKPDIDKEKPKNDVTDYIDKLLLPDPKKINKLPPIPKINRDEGSKDVSVPNKRRKEIREKKKKREEVNEKESDKDSSTSSPEKRAKNKEIRKRMKEIPVEPEPEKSKETVVEFKELKNYKKDRYMRRNKEKSESPENTPEEKEKTSPDKDSSNTSDVLLENKDVDLRVLPVVEPKPAVIGQKRSSTETLEGKIKKTKLDKFDILFGNEDVDLRQLPQVEEVNPPPPPVITESPKNKVEDEKMAISPRDSPKQKDWNEVKEKDLEETKKTPSKLDLVRAKLAEATKGKDRLGRPLLFTKSPSIEKERRRTLSDRAEDTEQKNDSGEDFDAEDHKKSISIIMSQAKEQFNDGQLDKNQYNTLMYQVLQLNEKLKLKEAKQRESLEISKRKLKAHIDEENNKVPSPKSSPSERNNFGDIDERVTPSVFLDTPPDSQSYLQDSDMRINPMSLDGVDGPKHHSLLPMPMMPMFGPYNPMWRGQPRPRMEDYGPRRFRGPVPPFHRGKFDKRVLRPPFEPRLPPLPPLPTPQIGMCQSECPLRPYERTGTPPPLGAPGVIIPPTDYNILDYIDQDPVKTIQIDGVPREIRFYGDTAIIMLDWDDPREIKFLPGCRRVTFDNKDSVVLSFNEGYKQVEIDDQVFDIKFGAPTRELYINGRWHECFFGGQPLGVIIDGKPRLVHLEGPLPQVDIGKVKRTDLVAGKINLIVNATLMCPVYLDAKVQKFHVNGQFFTIRFVDSLMTVLINEQPFQVDFGDLPKPIFVGNEKYFIRFSALPRNIRPGFIKIANMEGESMPFIMPIKVKVDEKEKPEPMETDEEQPLRPSKTPSPDTNQESQGLDVLASVMPSSTAPASASEYSLAEPLFVKPDKIPGLETLSDEVPQNPIPSIQNINVTDLFQKLVAIGIVKPFGENKEEKPETKAEEKPKPKEDKSLIHRVDLLKPETLRVKQPGAVARLYGGMQCSGCGARFPPEHTVRYSQHLDWHFRQNRRERDSARRAHSRHWHYDLPDWLQYEEVEDLDEREKSWFETGGAEGEGGGEGAAEAAEEAPSVAAGLPHEHACALCGDKFDQFYNEDKEEWHLRNSVRHEDNNYHPLCFDDYKASLAKDEPTVVPTDEVKPNETIEEAIEIKDVEEEMSDHSDNESVVEVIEAEPKEMSEPVEIDEGDDGDEDDVVLKAEPVEEVVVEDDADTDDETSATRAERDRLAALDFANVKVKQEPVDPDDEPIITEEETIKTNADTTHATVLSSIDGNIQFETAPTPAQTLPIGGIRINISKSIPSFITNNDDKMFDDISADDEPLPPGEEPELEYKLKPALEGVQLRRQPPLNKGNELSGLCSIM